MEFFKIGSDQIELLKPLQIAYKQEIGEDTPAEDAFRRLQCAMEKGQIVFYGCMCDGKPAACCSVSAIFSTFDYLPGGIFEDFYILPEFRHQGIARKLVRFAYETSGVSSLIVGCADCDLEMYKALGFSIPLGNMLAFEG